MPAPQPKALPLSLPLTEEEAAADALELDLARRLVLSFVDQVTVLLGAARTAKNPARPVRLIRDLAQSTLPMIYEMGGIEMQDKRRRKQSRVSFACSSDDMTMEEEMDGTAFVGAAHYGIAGGGVVQTGYGGEPPHSARMRNVLALLTTPEGPETDPALSFDEKMARIRVLMVHLQSARGLGLADLDASIQGRIDRLLAATGPGDAPVLPGLPALVPTADDAECAL